MSPLRSEGFGVRSYHAVLAFSVGIICGAACIPAINVLIYGDLDPFAHGWPLVLECSAFVLVSLIAASMRYGSVAASGLYSGLVAVVFAVGDPEYPLSTMVALAIHGLLPALAGGVLSGRLRYFFISRGP